MMPPIIEALVFQADDWYHVASDHGIVLQDEHGVDPANSVLVAKNGHQSYTVTLRTPRTTVEFEDLDAVTATATALGVMQSPALFEQNDL